MILQRVPKLLHPFMDALLFTIKIKKKLGSSQPQWLLLEKNSLSAIQNSIFGIATKSPFYIRFSIAFQNFGQVLYMM
jgi:hypothetical protein